MKKFVSMLCTRTQRSIRLLLLIILLISVISVGIFASYSLQPLTIPLEVEDPIKVLDYPSGFNLFPGETKEFNITVKNLASINYSISLDFYLNDTVYQAKYVTFSNKNYTIAPGEQNLNASITVSSNAPPANLLITVNPRRGDEQARESPSSSQPSIVLLPSLVLLGSGAKWAAVNGSTALYINWKDNWFTHHLTDGANWGPWPSESTMDNRRLSISQTLQQSGFEVNFAGDIPESLNGYDLVVIFAYWAVEPRHEPLIRDYLSNGGGVVILAGVPCYFAVSCKDWWPYRFGGTNLNPIQEWFGCRSYVNTGGYANVVVDNPFGTALLSGDTLLVTESHSWAAVTSLNNNTRVVAQWGSGTVFAFTHEYGQGRVYYQAGFQNSSAALFES